MFRPVDWADSLILSMHQGTTQVGESDCLALCLSACCFLVGFCFVLCFLVGLFRLFLWFSFSFLWLFVLVLLPRASDGVQRWCVKDGA